MLMSASSSSSPRHRGSIERGVDGGNHRVIGGRAGEMCGDRLQERIALSNRQRRRRALPSFDRIRYRRHDASVFLYAFDLIELNGDDLRRDPLDARKAALASVLAKAAPGLRFNEPSRPTVQPCSRTPARWAWRGSCRSARTPLTAADGRPIGSRASPTSGRRRKIGGDDQRRARTAS
jgi:hypothetical protein